MSSSNLHYIFTHRYSVQTGSGGARVEWTTCAMRAPVPQSSYRSVLCTRLAILMTVGCTVHCHFCVLCKWNVYRHYSVWYENSNDGKCPNKTLFNRPVPTVVTVAICLWVKSRVTQNWQYITPRQPAWNATVHYNLWNTFRGIDVDQKDHVISWMFYWSSRATATVEWKNKCPWPKVLAGTDGVHFSGCT